MLITNPEQLIQSDWGGFVDQLNVYFGQPNLAQSSECALHALKMQDYQHINKYMIKFSEHATHMGGDDAALYGEFYRGLTEYFIVPPQPWMDIPHIWTRSITFEW